MWYEVVGASRDCVVVSKEFSIKKTGKLKQLFADAPHIPIMCDGGFGVRCWDTPRTNREPILHVVNVNSWALHQTCSSGPG